MTERDDFREIVITVYDDFGPSYYRHGQFGDGTSAIRRVSHLAGIVTILIWS
jgi:hypothetical protein